MADKLLVNPIDCQAHGACAELLPEMITLDEWGYPIVDPRPLPPALERFGQILQHIDVLIAGHDLSLRCLGQVLTRIAQSG